jgi:transposase
MADEPSQSQGQGTNRLAAADQMQRDAQIVAARTRGLSRSQIANTYGVSETTIDNVMERWRAKRPKLRNLDPVKIIEEHLERYEAAQEELAMLAATTKQDAVRVGAVKARLDAMEKATTLMQQTGVLPHDLGVLRVQVDLGTVAQKMLEVLDRHQVGPELRRELADAIQPRAIAALPPGS